MEVTEITTLISNMGFPIACVIILFWQLRKQQEEHKAEAEKWTEAVNNNTRVMERLVDRIDQIERMVQRDDK